MRRITRTISMVLAAVLALTLTACGGGSSSNDQSSAGSGTGAETDTNCVYSAEQIMLEDEEGFLTDLNVDSLAYRDGRLYATGFSYDYSDTGSHILLNFAEDGSDLQYSMLMGGGMEDVISMSIGEDGSYYIARISYDTGSMGFSTVTDEQNEHSADSPDGATAETAELIEDDAPVNVVEEEGSDSEGPGGEPIEESTVPGPAGAYEEEAVGGEEGPVAEEDASSETDAAAEDGAAAETDAAAQEGPGGEAVSVDPEMENAEEFVTEGGDSPANDPTLREESTDGITSPADEFKDSGDVTDGEEELIVEEVEDVDPSEMAGNEKSAYVLTCITADGQELWTVPAEIPKNSETDFYINNIAYSAEGIIVSTSAGLDLYDAQNGSFIRTISTEQAVQSATPYVLEDGTVIILSYGNTGEEISVVNMETGELGEGSPIPSEVGTTALFPGKTYQLYLAGTDAVYGMNLDGSEPVKVLDYVDSDMDITAVTSLVELPEERFAVVVADLTGTSIVEILTKVDPETVANRKTITLGSYYLDYEVRKQVFAFNKQSQDVRVSIVDYSKYDGDAGTEGLTKLNTDIASGSAPDILILSPIMPVKSYISKGVFEDLTPYMEADEEISTKEYLNNIFDAFKTDGKTYAVIPSFYVNTIVGKTEDIGDGSGLTLDFVDQLAASKGVEPAKIFGLATRNDVLYAAMELCGDQFIDWDKSECKFDSAEFIRLLEFIKQFPAKIEDNGIQEDTTAYYRSGKALLSRESIGTFDEYVNLRYGVFGTEVTMTGFPSQNPGSAVIFPQLEIAVNASSDYKDGCWSFVRRFLLDEYQDSIEMYWPVSINALDQMANEATEPLYYTDENGNRVEDHIMMNIGGETIELPRISDTEVDQMYAFLKGLTSEAYFDGSVENIIAEEAAAFFVDQKSAKDVAGVIQSRVQIYINENS